MVKLVELLNRLVPQMCLRRQSESRQRCARRFVYFFILPPRYCIVFIHFYSAFHSMSLSEALPTTVVDTVSEFTRRSASGAVSEGLAQGPYLAARAGFEPTTLRSKGVVYTNAPPRPTNRPASVCQPPFMSVQASRRIRRALWSMQLYNRPLNRHFSLLGSTQ